MNSKKKHIQKTSGTRKNYKPGQLITICKNVFRIVKNRSAFTDCYMCDFGFREQSEWCKHCINGCYCKLVKKHNEKSVKHKG